MKNKLYFLLILLASATVAFAGAPVVEEPETVIVPFDATKPVESQNPTSVYIPYERFVELWQAAKINKRPPQPEKIAVPYVLSSSRYDAKLADGALHVTGVIDLQTFNDGWVSVPLAFREVKLGVLKLDGQTASLAANGVAIEKAGNHRIELEFEIPLGSDKTHLSWGIPKTAGTLFSITLPDKQMKASVQPGEGVVERINGDQKIVTAALGSTEHIDLLLDSSVGLSTITQAAVAKIETTLDITPAVELLHTGFEFSFPESQQDHFTVSLDKALALIKLDVPNLKSWKLTVGNDSQSLEITLAEPARGSFKFSIDAERSSTERQRKFPFISAAANRIEQTTALFSTAFMDVTPQPTAALRQISFPGEQNTGVRLVAAYSSIGDRELLAYGVQPAKLTNKADISYVYLVNHSKIELVAALKLQAKNETLFEVSLGLPGDFVVEAVDSDRLKDWWREGDILHARFKGNAPDAVNTLVLHLVKLYKTTPDALEIKPLTLPDSWDVVGNGIIAASSSVQAEMTLAEAKEVNPQEAATDFRILPPMERKCGFTFKGQNFHASLKLETLPARVDGIWVMSAQAHESSVSVSTHVNLTARQGSASGVSFRLPASMPEARVTGDNVRETTSAVDGKWRVYNVAFQNDLTDQTGFTVDFDLPGDGNITLPSFEFVDIERAEGFVIVDNVSEYKMEVKPTGLEVALNTQIPYLPLVSRNASLYRALPGWSLDIVLTKLEKEAGRSALVEYEELSTAIRADGSEWHRALYHLDNRSLQFLPVKLPDGSELASVTVAGENVRADRGKVDGKDVLLVPLIKAKSGDLPYDVSLVYRKTGKSLWTISHEALADPEVVGITVDRTIWHLYVPEGSEAGHFGGNMEQVLDEMTEAEKVEATLEDAKKQKSLALNGDQNAEENYKREIKSAKDYVNSKESVNLYGNADDQANQEENQSLAAKKQEIQKKVVELDEAEKSDAQNMSKPMSVLAVPVRQASVDKQQSGVGHTQTWVNNGAYIAGAKGTATETKTKEADQKNTTDNQLYVNDYIVNVQSGANFNSSGGTLNSTATGNNSITVAGTGNLTISGNNTYTGATVVNGGVLSTQGGRDALTQTQGSQLEALRQANPAAANGPSGTPGALGNFGGTGGITSGGQITSGLRSGGEAITGDSVNSILGFSADAAAPNGTANTGSPVTQNAGGNVKVLNNARANIDTNSAVLIERQQQDAAKLDAAAQPGDFEDGFEGHGDGKGEGQGEGGGGGAVGGGFGLGESQAKAEGAAGLGFGGTTYARGVLVGPAQLQPAGSISLPIDFPTEGLRVYHFQKLKSNATLTFWITNERGLDKWKWVFVFLLVAAVTKGVFMFIDRGYLRVLRRRVVHI